MPRRLWLRRCNLKSVRHNLFVCLFVCLFIPFNVLYKSMTIVRLQILRSGFDPETHSKGPPNSRLFKPTVLYIHAAAGKK